MLLLHVHHHVILRKKCLPIGEDDQEEETNQDFALSRLTLHRFWRHLPEIIVTCEYPLPGRHLNTVLAMFLRSLCDHFELVVKSLLSKGCKETEKQFLDHVEVLLSSAISDPENFFLTLFRLRILYPGDEDTMQTTLRCATDKGQIEFVRDLALMQFARLFHANEFLSREKTLKENPLCRRFAHIRLYCTYYTWPKILKQITQ